jgi:hypothetical protein
MGTSAKTELTIHCQTDGVLVPSLLKPIQSLKVKRAGKTFNFCWHWRNMKGSILAKESKSLPLSKKQA